MASLSLMAILDKEKEQFTLTNFGDLKVAIQEFANRYKNLVVRKK